MNNRPQLKRHQSFDSQPFGVLKNNSSTFPLVEKRKLTINYKNFFVLKKYMTKSGKILPRRLTKLNSKEQRCLAKSIKNARILGFLSFIRQV